jgi:hypothetical protein
MLANVSVFLIQHHAMKEHKELEVNLHPFLTLAPEGGLAVLPLGNESLVHWMGSSDTDNMVEKRGSNCKQTVL